MKTLTHSEALANACHHHALPGTAPTVEAMAGRLVGLHNTSQASPYLSVRARLPGFARQDLDGPMWGSWRLARFRAMRLTMFIFPTDLLEIAAAATRPLRERFAARWLRDSGLSQREYARQAAAIDEGLTDGPRTVRGLRRALDVPQSVDLPGIVARLCDEGRLVGGAPARHWRSSIRQYHRRRDVLPDLDLNRWGEEAAVTELIRHYVASYGPVTVADVAWWTGLSKGRCRAALDAVAVEEVAVDGWPGPLYRLAGTAHDHAVTDHDGTDYAVAVLPLLDPYVQGYRDRDRFLEPERHGYVYDGGGNSAATLVLRGRIVGVWQVGSEPDEHIRYHLFAGGPASLRDSAEAGLAEAGMLYFDRAVDIRQIEAMQPLRAGGGRSAEHPLDSRVHRASRRQ